MKDLLKEINRVALATEKANSLLTQVVDNQERIKEENHFSWWALRTELEALKDYLGIEYREKTKLITKKFVKRHGRRT